MPDIASILSEISQVPSDEEDFRTWLEQKDAISVLDFISRQDDLVLYASFSHVFMHVVLVPESLVSPPDSKDLMSWNFGADSTWGISYDYSEPPSVSVSPPLDATGSKAFDEGEQLVFLRFFEGRIGEKNYIEILQKLIHLLDLHFLPERNAYCRLDKHGDIEEILKIIEVAEKGEWHGGTVITIRRDDFDDYMVLTDSVAVMTFDFTRFRPDSFSGWGQETGADVVTNDAMSYRLVHYPGYGSYLRGYQLIYPRTPRERIIRRLRNEEKEERQYASFIAVDWKNDVIAEISCAPESTTNYFTRSDLPFDTSPAFFRPEVLSKYKADSEKYRLDDRSITCRGAWHLKTYDINEEGQVHTYLGYLRHLPYEEQLHWKAYNEKPKGPISSRAFKTDFEGSWDQEYDPLRSLKSALDELQRQRVPWWSLRSQDLPEQVHYPMTSSPDEWSNEILRLDQLIVEGLEEKWLRKKAQELGRTPEQQFRSLKLIEECLIALNFQEDHAREITSPLHEVHNLRSKLKGHASGNTSTAIKQKVLTEHGNFRRHFRALSQRCDESIKTIIDAFKDSRFSK